MRAEWKGGSKGSAGSMPKPACWCICFPHPSWKSCGGYGHRRLLRGNPEHRNPQAQVALLILLPRNSFNHPSGRCNSMKNMQHRGPSKAHQALLHSDGLTLGAHAASERRLSLQSLASRKSIKQWPCRIWPRKGVVMAAGAWTPHLAHMIGSAHAPGLPDSSIQPRKGHLLELPASRAPAIKHGLMEIGYAKVCQAYLKHCFHCEESPISERSATTRLRCAHRVPCLSVLLDPWTQGWPPSCLGGYPRGISEVPTLGKMLGCVMCHPTQAT